MKLAETARRQVAEETVTLTLDVDEPPTVERDRTHRLWKPSRLIVTVSRVRYNDREWDPWRLKTWKANGPNVLKDGRLGAIHEDGYSYATSRLFIDDVFAVVAKMNEGEPT